MFPGPGAQVYYNEEGEPLGWDYPSYDPPEPDSEYMRQLDEMWEAAIEQAEEEVCTADCDYPCSEHEAQIDAKSKEIIQSWKERGETP